MKTGEEVPNLRAQPIDIDEAMAQIEKGQQMAGHVPDKDALDQARRVLTGESSEEDAVAEVLAKYTSR